MENTIIKENALTLSQGIPFAVFGYYAIIILIIILLILTNIFIVIKIIKAIRNK